MFQKSTLLLAGIGSALFLTALATPSTPATPAPTPVEAKTFAIDATHSNVLFKVKHMKASWFYGRFNDISGQVVLDEADPSKSSVEVVVKAESVDAKNEKLNQHLRNADFFNATEFPEITFKSKSVKKGRERGTMQVDGELTLRGVTKPLSIVVEQTGLNETRRGTIAGFHTTFTIDRGEFGVSYGIDNGGVGKDVEMTISLEVISK